MSPRIMYVIIVPWITLYPMFLLLMSDIKYGESQHKTTEIRLSLISSVKVRRRRKRLHPILVVSIVIPRDSLCR